jgi:four helix bundle protein
MNRLELENRLVDFAVKILSVANQLKSCQGAHYYADQIIRSSGSSALNYGEAQAGESPRDFIHKNKIVLKELRETMICLKIIGRAKLCKSEEEMKAVTNENNELISIFVAAIKTSEKNQNNKGMTGI